MHSRDINTRFCELTPQCLAHLLVAHPAIYTYLYITLILVNIAPSMKPIGDGLSGNASNVTFSVGANHSGSILTTRKAEEGEGVKELTRFWNALCCEYPCP
jgi:hypothetical protein